MGAVGGFGGWHMRGYPWKGPLAEEGTSAYLLGPGGPGVLVTSHRDSGTV